MATGIPSITTSIAGQLITPISITSPTSGQGLVYNGTNFVNNNINTVSVLSNTRITSRTPQTVTVLVANTPVAFASSSITLNVGTHIFEIHGLMGTGNANLGSIEFLKTGGTGTFTSSGCSVAMTSFASSIIEGSLANKILVQVNTSGTTSPAYCVGKIIVSTSSVTLSLAGNSSTVGTIVTLDQFVFYTTKIV
jgi:hypothetical protein